VGLSLEENKKITIAEVSKLKWKKLVRIPIITLNTTFDEWIKIWPGIVDSTEAPVADLAEIVEDFVRILALKELRHVRILEGAGSGDGGHFFCRRRRRPFDVIRLAVAVT
jgi:hypothetical protein